ncbi:uracil-DNA glycosylase, partial [Rhodovulum sp. BSW8]
MTPQDALALLAWQVELGATEAIGESPVNRYDEVRPAQAPRPVAAAVAPAARPAAVDPVALARA